MVAVKVPRNVCKYIPDYTVANKKDTLDNLHREHLKSYNDILIRNG